MCSLLAWLAAYTAINEDTWDYLNGSTLAWISYSAEEQLQRWDILVVRWIYQEHWGPQKYIRSEEIRAALFHRIPLTESLFDSLNLHEINNYHSCFCLWWKHWVVQLSFLTLMTCRYKYQFPIELQQNNYLVKLSENSEHWINNFPEAKIMSVNGCFVNSPNTNILLLKTEMQKIYTH